MGVHLSERLAYEAAVGQQRLRTEISQVKREAEHFKSSVESGKRKRSRGSKDSASAAGGAVEQVATVQKPFVFQQKETEAQIRKRKMVEEVNTSASRIEPEVKKKKLKQKKVRRQQQRSQNQKRGKSCNKRPRAVKCVLKRVASARHFSNQFLAGEEVPNHLNYVIIYVIWTQNWKCFHLGIDFPSFWHSL